ncbi:hypothetical protein PRK78_007260 [Emydomyces testavorans]|uniref:Protein kinase domain-containing protein n=1 Tax=Emydomyces testavorans TaxID=2070801 RepID=A0AAF0IMI5_9EURO|nr:hypothetical protein PRK78_007260 [Emydomyces testavorans]
MSAARQLLKVLGCLHNGGIVHRDLNNGSVMWDISPLDHYTTDTKYQHLGRPQKIALPPGTWRRGELVKPMDVPERFLSKDKKIYLGDFGLAIKAGTTRVRQKVQSPAAYCAPERFHNVDPSFASDVWSYMCLFTELYLGFRLFFGTGNASVLSDMVSVFGPLPEQWKGSYSGGGGGRGDDS